MAHRALKGLRLGPVLALAIADCGEPPAAAPPPPRAAVDGPAPGTAPPTRDYATDDASWGRFHSKRFQLTVPLPDGRAWKIDDHRAPELVATHAATESRLALLLTREEELMNRSRCEERAKIRGWVPSSSLTTVDDQVRVGPSSYDSRVWVAVDATVPGGFVEGHVFLFGAFLRTCLLVHLTTRVPAKDEPVLASRLALASSRIVNGITLDPMRTTDDATVPRVKPDIRR